MFDRLSYIFNELRPKQLLILAGAAAIIMFSILYIALSNLVLGTQQSANVEPAMREVIVASTDILPMEVIQQGMLERKQVPADDVPAGAVTDMSAIIGSIAKQDIAAGEVVTQDKLHGGFEEAGMAGIIPPDCRAVSVKVSEITGVSGFAKSGNYVDVLLVEKNNTEAKTTMLLQNVLLLGVNNIMMYDEPAASDKKEDSAKKGTKVKGDTPSVATLALLPPDALKLVSAAKIGEIYLMLRPMHPKTAYVGDTDYTLASSGDSGSVGAGGGPSGDVSTSVPAPVTAASSGRPAPAFQPPSSPVTTGVSSSSGGGGPVSAGGFEIIQGDQTIR
ncbi:MAG: Flp pilus assembly protein CpaB [Selenomonas sp.]|uniref:Flp pilus assembly protein CpaB n=1 Tax=Selenomonas sp. TaxID=2053611 RepID=UPI0025DD35E7|nr:Flp pilus assembly protein CpaB [Selenomonas sp.]MCR5757746.1 Flp pilus assembly protein CpaB [Selenomonas sp.]